jgi:hypothetical protein
MQWLRCAYSRLLVPYLPHELEQEPACLRGKDQTEDREGPDNPVENMLA